MAPFRVFWRRIPPWVWVSAIASLVVVTAAEQTYEKGLVAENRATATVVIEEYADALESAFARRVAPLSALRALLESGPPGTALHPALEPFTDGLHTTVPGVRAYQYVRGGIIRFTSHPDSNPGVLGFDLTTNPLPGRGAGVRAVLTTDRVVLTGPVALIQGTTGFIARLRVFQPDDRRFGSVATVFDLGPVLREAGMYDAELLSGLRLAVRDARDIVILGDSTVFSGEHVQATVRLPGRKWSLAAEPAVGTWLGADAWRVRILAALLVLLLILLLFQISSRQQQLEVGLASEHALLLAVVEGSRDPVFVRDVEGRYVTVNAAAAWALGLTPEDFRGKRLEDLLPAHVAATVMEVHRAVLAEGKPMMTEVVLLVGEQERTFQTAHHPWRGPTGETLGVISLAHDITDRLALEEEARHAHRLEGLGRLAGGIAHDFNNLLTTIRGNADILTKSLPDAPPLIQEDLEAISTAARRGAELSRKLLAFSRFEPIARRPVDLVELVRSAAPGMRLPSHVTLKTSIPGDPTMVAASPDAVHQILGNLVDNAVAATQEGGTITVRVERDETQAHLVVEDTGVGMDSETAKRAFDPFFTTHGGEGAEGLGLSAVYGVVQQLGGNVTLTSLPNTGTTVIVSLPRLRVSGGAALAITDATDTVLVVEDEESVRRTATRALELQGYRVVAVVNGAEALKVLQSEHIDLVLTDMVMPVMDGQTLYREARKAGLTMPFVFCTGYTKLASDAARANLDGEFLIKPWTLDELHDAIRTALT